MGVVNLIFEVFYLGELFEERKFSKALIEKIGVNIQSLGKVKS